MMNHSPHLLVVDDDQRICLLLKKFLINSGYRVSVAYGASQARKLIQSFKFDLFICDVMMPGEDGVSFITFVRETMSVPIVLLTAKSDINDRISGLEAGADEVFNYKDADFVEQFLASTDGIGADKIIEVDLSSNIHLYDKILKPKGSAIIYGTSEAIAQVPSFSF